MCNNITVLSHIEVIWPCLKKLSATDLANCSFRAETFNFIFSPRKIISIFYGRVNIHLVYIWKKYCAIFLHYFKYLIPANLQVITCYGLNYYILDDAILLTVSKSWPSINLTSFSGNTYFTVSMSLLIVIGSVTGKPPIRGDCHDTASFHFAIMLKWIAQDLLCFRMTE